jgi:proteasome lid subunit RPN8/RPN11
VLVLPAALQARLLDEARTALPAECCGFLEGVRNEAGVWVSAVHPAANLAPDPLTGFEIDPATHFALLRTLRGTGRVIVGCYHSHPNGRARPSSRDLATICERGFVWIILAVGDSEAVCAFECPGFAPLDIRAG